jgi:hypothetical protein
METTDIEDAVQTTTGHFYLDGTVIELMRGANNKGAVLVRWKDGNFEIADQVEYSGTMYTAAPIAPNIERALRLPARIGPPENIEVLFGDLHTFLAGRSGQPDSCITPLVFAVLASWLCPVLPIAPIVSIFAPPGSPKTRILQLLEMVCRRPLCIAGLTRSEMLRLPWSLGSTLLLDEPEPKPAMQAILRASSQRGMHLMARRDILDAFGPKILISSTPENGLSVEDNALRVALIPISGVLPAIEKHVEDGTAEEFQARLLGYFLRNFNNLVVPKFDVSHLRQPLQLLAQTLGSVVVGDEKLQAKILPIVAIQNEEQCAESARSLDSVVIEALLFFVHEAQQSRVRAQEVAEKVSLIYEGRGFQRTVSAESVGWTIKRLRIPSGRIDRAGNGVELTADVCRQAHRLALAYGVQAIQSGVRQTCRFCEEFQVADGVERNQ